MAAVSLPSRVLGRKIKTFGAIVSVFFVVCIFGHLGGLRLCVFRANGPYRHRRGGCVVLLVHETNDLDL